LISILSVSALNLTPSATAQSKPTLPDVAEQISDMQINVELNQNTTARITEDITYQTLIPKHGIFRYVPFRTPMNGESHLLRLTNTQVSSNDGPMPSQEYRENGNYVFKIGDPDSTF